MSTTAGIAFALMDGKRHGVPVGAPCNICNSEEIYAIRINPPPLGINFYTGQMFPEEYKGDIIVAQHGSWNRSSKIGYRLIRVQVDNQKVTEAEVFADGWLNNEAQEAWGRPVDVLQLPDGSLLVSDDHAGLIYRIAYEG